MEELYEARKDFLTNCYTRDSLNPFLSRMESNYNLHKAPFSVFILDVDRFKSLNDKYGHLCGDEVLKYFSSSIRLDLEEEVNAPFRFGGDEFIVVFPGKAAREAHRLAQRLRKNIKARPCLYKGRGIQMGFSGGIASFPQDAKNSQELLEKADQALYASKNKGRGRVTTYGQMKDELLIKKVVLAFAVLAGLAMFFITRNYPDSVPKMLIAVTQKTFASFVPRPSGRMVRGIAETPPPAPAPIPPPAPTPLSVEPPPSRSAGDIVYFKTGGVLKGTVVSEDDEAVRIQPNLTAGKASLKIKKSDILKIERDAAV